MMQPVKQITRQHQCVQPRGSRGGSGEHDAWQKDSTYFNEHRRINWFTQAPLTPLMIIMCWWFQRSARRGTCGKLQLRERNKPRRGREWHPVFPGLTWLASVRRALDSPSLPLLPTTLCTTALLFLYTIPLLMAAPITRVINMLHSSTLLCNSSWVHGFKFFWTLLDSYSQCYGYCNNINIYFRKIYQSGVLLIQLGANFYISRVISQGYLLSHLVIFVITPHTVHTRLSTHIAILFENLTPQPLSAATARQASTQNTYMTLQVLWGHRVGEGRGAGQPQGRRGVVVMWRIEPLNCSRQAGRCTQHCPSLSGSRSHLQPTAYWARKL